MQNNAWSWPKCQIVQLINVESIMLLKDLPTLSHSASVLILLDQILFWTNNLTLIKFTLSNKILLFLPFWEGGSGWIVMRISFKSLMGKLSVLKISEGTSLVVQWLRIRLPMQGTRVWALVREDPTCRGATKPISHNYWACALEPASHNYWALAPQLLKPTRLEPMLCNKRSHRKRSPCTATKSSPPPLQLEKACTQQQGPNAAKEKNKIK